MPNPSAPILEMITADIASVRAEQLTVISAVNWRVETGDFWVLGSRPGAGKTALLQTAAGIQRPAAGALRLFDRALDGLSERELLALRLKLSLVFEGGGRLFQHLTVGENVALPYCYHQECPWEQASERLAEVLTATGLMEYADSPPARLPRALCPRAGLARALMSAPEMLLLDNPLRGIESSEQTWWLTTLAKLNAQSAPLQSQPLSLVVAVEDMRPWMDLGSHFALIHENQFLTLGGPEAARKNSRVWQHDLLAPPATTG